ncbi:MAG TPA: helix-turn-helix domain-containing protein [Candidatus Wunengus sp. YC61]|uniref:helix-turn-helix domain-containing protein n=1 Tax=Candidatus Wunengus sp. YC61 TaxID=3367698 RepID=UPI0040253D7B
MNEIMTIKQVAEYLKVSPRSIYKLVKDGAIPTFRIMNMWRFERSKIDQWINKKNGINNSVTVQLTAEHAKIAEVVKE